MKQPLFIFFGVLTAALHATPVYQLDVDALVMMAFKASPDLNISRADYNASVQRANSATGDYLPRLDFTGGAGITGVKNENDTVKVDESSSLLTGTLSASQLLYDFGKTGGNIRAYSTDANASYQSLQQAYSDKIYAVKKEYYEVLKARSLIGVNAENVTLNERQLFRSERYFNAGIRTKIDVADARVNLISAQLDLQNANYEFDRARIKLTRAVGINPYGGNYTLAGEDLNTTNLVGSLPDVSNAIDTLETYAEAHRYELKSFAQKALSASKRVTSARGDYFPGLYLKGDYTRNETDKALQLFVPQQQYTAYVALSWNLFEGFKTNATVAGARAEKMRAAAALGDARLRIRQEVADAQVLLLKSRDGVILSQSLAEAAKEKFIQAQKRYENGLSDFIELQQARQGYIDAASNLVIHYYDFYIALANRERAIGR